MEIIKQVKAALTKYDEAMLVLIKGGEVMNVTVVNESSKAWLYAVVQEYDVIELVGERDRPAPGWVYDGMKWTVPPTAEPTPEKVEAVEKAKDQVMAAERRRRSLCEEAERILADPSSTFADRAAAQDLLDRGR